MSCRAPTPNTQTTIHASRNGSVWLGVSPHVMRAPHQIHRLPFILEEECVVGCKPAVMSSSPNTETTIHTRGGVCGWV